MDVTSSGKSYEHTLVHVVFLGVDVHHPVHHLAAVSGVSRHVLGVLIVIGVRLRNGRVDGSI